MQHHKATEIVEHLLNDEASFGDAVFFCACPSFAIDDEVREYKIAVWTFPTPGIL